MTWSDIPWQPTTRLLRQFAMLCVLMFTGLAVMQWWHERFILATVLAAIAAASGVVGAARPRWLGPVYVACMVLVFPLGWLVLNVCLAVVYFGMITPLACWFRLIGRDPLERRPHPDKETYLQTKPEPPISNYYRTY